MSKKSSEKKKDREKDVKAKLLRRRQAMRTKTKKEREEAREQRNVQRTTNRLEGKTYINRSIEEQRAILEKNMEILKALEEEQNTKEPEAPQLQATPPQTRARGMKASAEVAFIPNPLTNEPLKEN